jgi:hypothetical protein
MQQEHPQYSLVVLVTMRSGFMPQVWNQTNLLFSKMALLLPGPYMVQALALRGIRGWSLSLPLPLTL